MGIIKPRASEVKNDSVYEQLRNRLKIDRNELDKSVEEQAQVFFEVCEQHVNAISHRDEARDKLSRRDAELARETRQGLEKSGARATEAIINDSVMLHKDHIDLSAELAVIKKQTDLWGILRDSFDQRMRMIRELVNLYAIGYYGSAGTIAPRNTVRDSLAATARTKMDEDRKNRRQA